MQDLIKMNNKREIAVFKAPEKISTAEAKDILSKMLSIKPWQIKLEDQKAAKNALPILALALIEAEYQDAAYWIGRLLAHFPRRESLKDGIVISDIAGDMVDEGIPHVAIIYACDKLRRAATAENPWCPPSGEILKQARDFARNCDEANQYLSQNLEDVVNQREIENLIRKIEYCREISVHRSENPPLHFQWMRLDKISKKKFTTWREREKNFYLAMKKWSPEMIKRHAQRQETVRYGQATARKEMGQKISEIVSQIPF